MSVQQLARYEFKYPIDPDTLPAIRRAFQRYCVLDKTGVCDEDGFYAIDSLYFDTPDYRFYWNGENQTAVRLKLRARTYPNTPGSIVKLEVKRRSQDLITKTSTVVPKQSWQEWIQPGKDLTALPSSARRSLETFVGLQRSCNASPKVLVRYWRQAFHSAIDDYVRVTFDRKMLYQRVDRYDLNGDSRRWASVDDSNSLGAEGALLMELKFKQRPPVWIADVIRKFGLVRQGFSKYGSALRRVRLDTHKLWDLAPTNANTSAGGWAQWTS